MVSGRMVVVHKGFSHPVASLVKKWCITKPMTLRIVVCFFTPPPPSHTHRHKSKFYVFYIIFCSIDLRLKFQKMLSNLLLRKHRSDLYYNPVVVLCSLAAVWLCLSCYKIIFGGTLSLPVFLHETLNQIYLLHL